MANNKQYVDILNMVAVQEESRLITIVIFGIILVLVALLLPSKILTLTLANAQKTKKHSNQTHLKKKRTFCYKPILVMLSFMLLISGGIYKTIELRKITNDICEKNFVVYEGLFQYDTLYHDYYYGRIDFLDKNGVITGYAFYPDRTNSHQTYSNKMNELLEKQTCEGIIVYSPKSKIILDLTITTE